MSALPDTLPRFRPMRDVDLDQVVNIESAIYTHPWTRGNFADSLIAGHSCWVLDRLADMIGYGVMMMGPGEAHLLNLSVAHSHQRRGYGRTILEFFLTRAREFGATQFFLEVRVSNGPGRALYANAGMRELAVRRAYYPAHQGREDAIVMGMPL